MAISQAQLDIIIKAIAEGKGLKEIQADLDQVERSTGDTGFAFSNLQNILATMGIGIGIAEVVSGLRSAMEAAREAREAEAQLDAALTSTGGAAGITKDELLKLSTALENHSNFTDEAVQKAQSLLLTFTNIGSNVFPQATQAVADMAQRLGGDMSGAALQVGKALQDPIAGLTALSRVGVSFTDAQRAQIEEMVRTNDIAGAQTIILAELNKEFGGSAQAARDAAGGAQDFTVALGRLQETVGQMAGGGGTFDLLATAGSKALDDLTGRIILVSALFEKMQGIFGSGNEAAGVLDTMANAANFLADTLTYAGPPGQALAYAIRQVVDTAQEAVPASDIYQSSLYGQQIAAREATAANQQLANSIKEVSSASGLTNREADAYRQMAEARGQSVEIQAQFEQEQTRQAEEERRKEADKSAKQMTQSFSQAANQITNSISGAINSLVSSSVSAGDSWVSQALGVDQAGQDRIEEDVRRMAAVAQGGLADVNAAELAAKLSGVKDAVAQAYVQAFSTGDDKKLKAAAKQLALSPIVELYNVEAITQQIETQLRQQRLSQQINDKVNALLGEKGLGAIQQVTQQVQGVVDTTGQAAQQTSAEVTTVGTSAETTGKQISQAFSGAIVQIDILNERFRLMAGLIERVNTLAKSAGGSISGMNPPAAPTNDAANKMGGNSPL